MVAVGARCAAVACSAPPFGREADPKGVYLVTTVDIADTDEVIDLFGDRLVELQVNEGLSIYVTQVWPLLSCIVVL